MKKGVISLSIATITMLPILGVVPVDSGMIDRNGKYIA